MQAATDAIARVARRRRISDPDGGLQTTLIIAVCPPGAGTAGYAYIGDGMGVCFAIGEDERPRPFLMPHKADALQTNLLSACLGPQVLGAPCSGQFERAEGEFIVLATDGVADRVGTEFFGQLLAYIEYCGGDLCAACEAVLKQMADLQDAAGYICDDNMTLAISGCGVPPGQGKPGGNGRASSGKPQPACI